MMRVQRVFFALLIIGLGTFSSAQAIEIQEVVSKGGIRAWLIEDHTIPLISLDLAFKGGAATDPEDKAGLASFTAGLMRKGAGELDEQAFEAALEDRSIGLHFSASRDAFYGSLQMLTESRDEAFRLLALSLSSPRFDPGPMERQRARLLASLERQETSASAQASLAFWRTAFPGHPYSRPARGDIASVQSLSTEDMRAFVSNRLARNNLVIGVVGDIDKKTLAKILDRTFSVLRPQANEVDVPEFLPAPPPGIHVIDIDQPQSSILFGHTGVKIDHPDWFAIRVLEHLVGGGGLNSFLGIEVREKRGLAYSMSTQLVALDRAGLFFGGGGTQNARVGETVEVVSAELERVRREGVTAEQMRDAVTFMTGSYVLNFDTSSKMSANLVTLQRLQLPIDYISTRNERVQAVTLADVNRVAKTFLRPDLLHWVIAGKPEGLDESLIIERTLIE